MNLNNTTLINTLRGKIVSMLLLLAVLLTSFLTFSQSSFINVSVLHLPEHAVFDGTVPPVKKVPNWVQNDSSKWGASYSELSGSELIPLPEYKPLDLVRASEELSWSDTADVLIRNEKITYSTPYMGNYRLDGREYAGSHLAVDIKIPKGTPIYSIANGVVIKVSNQSSGFGHHIVVQHNDAPTYGQESVKTTLYSSYSHLDVISVSEGDVVTKGQKLATSGQTGTATTPHLHFQIDTDEAPWHPYWPFTWSEAQAAGLDFFSAVNAGLGKEKALNTTVNPMKYVQKYANGVSIDDSNDVVIEDVVEDVIVADIDQDVEDVEVVENTVDDTHDVAVDDVEETPVVVTDPAKLQFDFTVNGAYTEGLKGQYSVLLRDQYGKPFKNGFTGNVIVKSERGLFTPKPSILSVLNFDSGMRLDGILDRTKPGKDRIKVEYDGDTYYSDWFRIQENKANDVVDDVETATVDLVKTPDEAVVASTSIHLTFSDVPSNHEYFDAIEYLAERGVIGGYEDGTFRPERTVNRTEALKFIFLGAKLKLNSGDLPFTDTDKDAWYGRYVYTAFKNDIVKGYEDGTYRPANTVTRAEFFKMLFEAMEVDIDAPAESSFLDVKKADWFAKYAMYAKEVGVISRTTKKFNPTVGMTRGDVAYAMWRLMK